MVALATMPGRLPILGHAVAYARAPLAFLEHAAELGPLVRFDFPRIDSVLVNDPDLVEEVLVTENRRYVKDRFAQDLRRVLGNGLLTSEGDFWRRQRRLVQPAFHRDRIASYGRSMVECTIREIERWREGELRDVHADMMRLTLEIVGKTLFGADVGSRSREIGESLEAVMARYVDPIAMGVPHWDKLPTPLNRRFRGAVARLDRIVREIVDSHRAGATGDGADVLSMLLAARDDDGSGMSDDQLRDETITLILAGHETTAIALSWTWLLLSRHPDARAKLERELDGVLGGRAPTAADVARLPYLECVVRESMRLYPPAWAIGREPLEDVMLRGHRVAKGTQIWFAPWTMHRDARFFTAPLRFDPDRWAGDLARRIPKYAYFPFGGGPRLCIGTAFASLEIALVVATIAQQHRLELVAGHPIVLQPAITLRPKHGVRVRVTSRGAHREDA